MLLPLQLVLVRENVDNYFWTKFNHNQCFLVGIETDEPGLLGTCNSSPLVDSQNLTSPVPNAAHSSRMTIRKLSPLLQLEKSISLTYNFELCLSHEYCEI